ncbi:MAG: FAD binding domain-containing protein [Candidatus Eremiobacterota bacterium]
MLRLQPFRLLHPTSWEEAARLLRDHPDARVLAGGTDLLPAMKLGQVQPSTLISLRDVPGEQVHMEGASLVLGARLRLSDLSQHPLVQEHLGVLARTAALVASPQVRNRATLGGNLCLDTRCRFVNQSRFWRGALGGCLKACGSECHAVPGGRQCVAALSSDLAPLLVALDASLRLLDRDLPVLELYRADGAAHLALKPGELLRQVVVPLPGAGERVTARKWRVRGSIDFPLVSVAVRLNVREGRLERGRVVVGVLGPRPRVVELPGGPLHEGLARDVAERVHRTCRPIPNVPYDPEYRRERLRVEVERAVRELL